MEQLLPSTLPGLKATPFCREHGYFSLNGREMTMMRHWWNFLEIFPMELAGNPFSRVQKKAVYRKVSCGNILLWNFLSGVRGSPLAPETARCCSQQELGDGEVSHTLQEPDDGEAVCAPRVRHEKSRSRPHRGCTVLEWPSMLHKPAKWAHLNRGGKAFPPAKPLEHQLTANWGNKNIFKVPYPFLQSRQGRVNFEVKGIQLITDM